MMMKPLLVIVALALCGRDAVAQVPATKLSSEVLQSCLLGTRADTWTALKLTRDQMQRVLIIQEACKEECAVAGAKKEANPISNADENTIMSELDNILSEDQYKAWLAYCAGSGTAGQAPK